MHKLIYSFMDRFGVYIEPSNRMGRRGTLSSYAMQKAGLDVICPGWTDASFTEANSAAAAAHARIMALTDDEVAREYEAIRSAAGMGV